MFQSLTTKTKKLFNLDREVSSGGLGISFNKRNAFLACVGESIERYCMSYFDKEGSLFCFWEDLPKNKRLRGFDLYSPKQYKSSKFLNPKKDKIYWTSISSWMNKKENVFWPSSLIYLPFQFGSVAETSSTGVSCHFNLNKAVLVGIFEIIERDALMINFLQRLNPPELDLESIYGKNKEFIHKILKKYNIVIYRLHHDVNVPTYLSYIWNGKGDNLHFGIGASADLDSDKAIEKSLIECLFTYFYSKKMMSLRQPRKRKIKTLYEHYLYYQGKNFTKLLFCSKKIKYKKENILLKTFFNDLNRNKINVYYKDLTTEDIKNIGLKVIKVVIPGFIDLNKNYNFRREDAKRFYLIPKKKGLKFSNKLSSMPHPFP